MSYEKIEGILHAVFGPRLFKRREWKVGPRIACEQAHLFWVNLRSG